ncbi:MAG: hypothetical protein Q9222_005680 [Ikaeria aurantiellina]
MPSQDHDYSSDYSSDLGSPKLPRSISAPALAVPDFHQHQFDDCWNEKPSTPVSCFFRLPLEIRNIVYSYFVASPVLQDPRLSLHRPFCVDDKVFRIGYFKNNTILPLLLVCQQMYVEVASLFYEENTFCFHISNLTSSHLSFFDKASPNTLQLLKNAYLRTQFFPLWPVGGSKHLHLPPPLEKGERNAAIIAARRQHVLAMELEGAKLVAEAALPASCAISINCHDTITLPVHGNMWQPQRETGRGEMEEWGSSSCHLWKLVLVKDSSGYILNREFRRIEWPVDPNKQ